MRYIGIIGEFEYRQISKILFNFIKNGILKVILLDGFSSNAEFDFDVLIINDKSKVTNEIITGISKVKFLLLNNDDNAFYCGKFYIICSLLTYGFNGKSCITLSSVVEEFDKIIHFCIQRKIRTLDNKLIEQQEFPVHVLQNNLNNSCILAGVSAGIVCGLSISDI